MTYEELLDSIERSMTTFTWCSNNIENYDKGQSSYEDWRNAAKEVARIAYEDAAKDPKAWCVLDRNGESVRIGDRMKTSDGIVEVCDFKTSQNGEFVHVLGMLGDAGFEYKPWKCEKVKPDTRDDVIQDIVGLFIPPVYGGDEVERGYEEANAVYDRIEAIVRAELEGGR